MASSDGFDGRLDQARSSVVRRGWHATIALLVLTGLIVQLWIAVGVSATPPGHAVGTLAGTSLSGRVVRVLSFFTIQSNILSGIVSAQLAGNPHRNGPVWRAVRLAALVGISVTGVVYSTVLAKVHEPHGGKEIFANTVFHYLVPILMVIGWVLFGPRPRVDLRTVALSLLYPVAWIVYTLIDGAVTSWYPYPFLDVITHGYARVAGNGALVVVLLGVVTALFWWGDVRLPKSAH